MKKTEKPMEKIKFDKVENIAVHIRFSGGTASCICLAKKKRCNKRCLKTIVKRDRYGDWRSVSTVDKYGLVRSLFNSDEE